ncbi:hypothetical protein [Methylomonas koyamae]|uniref:hypothetical protein n=1 Tax=Methylomonas koyamae TaxID=702114 RepID=UPI000BC2EA7A|nr:hypothetical protein [Methylomonas koyamae]ATG91418.1 hypothetical protein MKLM6_3226 [Methylomonas koyamae]
MAKRKQQSQTFIKGTAKHRRTEADYMSTLLETVTLEDWQAVVTSTVAAAKQGDAQARAWLGQYLVGKPAGKAPTPLTVVVQQLNGENPLVNRLSQRIISHHNNPFAHNDDEFEDHIKALVAAELAEKIPILETPSTPEPARAGADFDGEQNG